MFELSGKVMLGVAVIGLVCIGGFNGYTQSVDEKKIIEAFQDAMNLVLYPNELSMYGLSNSEIKEYVVEHDVRIVVDTIKLIHQRSGKDIGVTEVLGVLPPELEKSLEADRERLISQVNDILKEDE